MPDGTAVMDRPPKSALPRDVTPLDLPPRDIPREPLIPTQLEHSVPSTSDISEEPNLVPDLPHHDTEEIRRRVLESMGIGPQDLDENKSPLMSEEDIHPDVKKGIMAKLSEFFKGGSKLSKIAKFSAIPFALLAMIFMKGLKGAKRE